MLEAVRLSRSDFFFSLFLPPPADRTKWTQWACPSCTMLCLWVRSTKTGNCSSWPHSWTQTEPGGAPCGAWTPSRIFCSSSSDPPPPAARAEEDVEASSALCVWEAERWWQAVQPLLVPTHCATSLHLPVERAALCSSSRSSHNFFFLVVLAGEEEKEEDGGLNLLKTCLNLLTIGIGGNWKDSTTCVEPHQPTQQATWGNIGFNWVGPDRLAV